MTLLCYCLQIDLPVQLEIETVYNTCFLLVKQAVALSRFHVCFHVLLAPLSVPTCCSGNLCCCCVTSPGKPCWNPGMFDVGSALRRLQSLWFASIVSPDVKARVRRAGSRVVLARVGERWKGEVRESFAHWRLAFKQADLDPPPGGWSNQSVRMGRSPAHVHGFWGHAYVIWYFIHSMKDILTDLLYVCNHTWC